MSPICHLNLCQTSVPFFCVLIVAEVKEEQPPSEPKPSKRLRAEFRYLLDVLNILHIVCTYRKIVQEVKALVGVHRVHEVFGADLSQIKPSRYSLRSSQCVGFLHLRHLPQWLEVQANVPTVLETHSWGTAGFPRRPPPTAKEATQNHQWQAGSRHIPAGRMGDRGAPRSKTFDLVPPRISQYWFERLHQKVFHDGSIEQMQHCMHSPSLCLAPTAWFRSESHESIYRLFAIFAFDML